MNLGNAIARAVCHKRNLRNPRQTRREKDWTRRFCLHLIDRGMPWRDAVDYPVEVSLDYDPADAADDELSYMADDHRLYNG